ncbi:MAG TPA: Crp/Fnr family transcriptional regulator [Candidatus Binatia bacterium]|nr:Crp/Fnr family transcriptional regulator [Candidatus Binatia bacterium]
MRILSGIPLLEGIAENRLAAIAQRARCRRFHRGQLLTTEAGSVPTANVIVAGAAKWTIGCPQGRADLLLEILRAGDVFGEAEVFGGLGSPCRATALSDGELMVLPALEAAEMLASNPEMGVRWLELTCKRLQRMRQLAADAVFLDVGGRLYRRLMEICRVDPAQLSAGDRLEHGLSQRELASSVGASRESLNKLLAAWQREGLVTVARGVLVIRKPAALARAAAAAYGPPSFAAMAEPSPGDGVPAMR